MSDQTQNQIQENDNIVSSNITSCLSDGAHHNQTSVSIGDYSPETLSRIAASFAAEQTDNPSWAEASNNRRDNDAEIQDEYQMSEDAIKLENDPIAGITDLESEGRYYSDRQMIHHRNHLSWMDAAKDETLSVRCRDSQAELHKSRLGSGSKGKCIKFKDDWMTPTEFEARAGRGSSKDWKRSIRFAGQTLQKLIDDEMLTPHAISCTCSICCGDGQLVNGPVRLFTPYKRKRKSSGDSFCMPSKINDSGRSYIIDQSDVYMLQQGSQVNGNNGQQFSPTQSHEVAGSSNYLLELEEICNQLFVYAQHMKTKIIQARLQEGQVIEAATNQVRMQFENENKHRYVHQVTEFKHIIKPLLTPEQDIILDQLIPPIKRCAHCGGDAFQQCCACVNVYYCNLECQRSDWINHQALCQPAKGQETLVVGDSHNSKNSVQLECNFSQGSHDSPDKLYPSEDV